MTDRERIYTELLAVRCKRGDKTAFAELVGQWERRLYYHIRRLVDSEEEASDILQETWMKALNGIRSLADTSRFPAWMYGIARHTAFSHLRRKISIRSREQGGGDYEDIAGDDGGWSFEDAETVHRALDKLPLLQKEILTLHFLEDLSVEETADVIGIPVGTVKSRLFNAKRALRAIIEEGEVRHES